MVRGRGSASQEELEAKRIISENINRLLKKQGKRKVDLHNETQIPKSSITGYVQGTSLPKDENLLKIAGFFKVPIEEIDPRMKKQKFPKVVKSILAMMEKLNKEQLEKVHQYTSNLLEKSESSNKIVAFPKINKQNFVEEKLYGKLSAGTGYYNVVDWDEETAFVPENAPAHDYLFQVEGNSMEPMFQNGELVYGKDEQVLQNGGIYALEVNYEDAYVKKVYIEKDHIRLVSLNEIYDDIIVTPEDSLKIVARIVL
ncbi:MAG: S24 family peptidase [Streptococcaceae bacterium]|nr:S24 family peptidase [Streptococcaceae bacterium]